MKRDVWAKPTLCGNFRLPVKATAKAHRCMNEVSVCLGLESKVWCGYFYLSADDAVILADKLREAASDARKDFRKGKATP